MPRSKSFFNRLIYITTTSLQKAISQSYREHQWTYIWHLRPTYSLPALPYMLQAKDLGISINPMYSHMVSQTCCKSIYFTTELTWIHVDCWGKTCVKSTSDWLLSWDLIWLASPALEKHLTAIVKYECVCIYKLSLKIDLYGTIHTECVISIYSNRILNA